MQPTIEIIRNPRHATMPAYLRDGDYLVVAIQDGQLLAICAFARRVDAKVRAASERYAIKRHNVRYASGFWRINDDGTWATI